MKDILEKLSAPLTKEDVELRVGSNSAKSFTLLLYKTARTDMKRLNEVCPNWSNSHEVDNKGSVKCAISIKNRDNEWVSREDVGSESNTEAEKGSYSDSFKRAGTRWGIGLELYNTDTIRLMWDMEDKGNRKFKPIKFFANNLEISKYEVVDGKPQVEVKYDGVVKFTNIKGAKKPVAPKQQAPKPNSDALTSIQNSLNACNNIGEFEVAKERIQTVTMPYFEKKKDTNTLKLLESMIEATAGRLK